MKSKIFLCPHCKTDCSTGDIICPECGRIVRNPPTTETKQKLSPVSWFRFFLIAAVIAVFAFVIYLGVYRAGIITG
jgi:hypothetical protein